MFSVVSSEGTHPLVISTIMAAADTQPQEQEQKLLLSRKESARILSLSLRSVSYLIEKGELKSRRVGSRVLIPRSELVKFARMDHPSPVAQQE
jgi:excisionase family DNA binding protein